MVLELKGAVRFWYNEKKKKTKKPNPQPTNQTKNNKPPAGGC